MIRYRAAVPSQGVKANLLRLVTAFSVADPENFAIICRFAKRRPFPTAVQQERWMSGLSRTPGKRV
ncbi:MAG: hypothetical protein JWR21_845 [Herminiimonas sp.]|nr:hypothetical protein [Herminiimonas sp.]MDB5852407.1 hypothetical protein [Herminiimonas sp.]